MKKETVTVAAIGLVGGWMLHRVIVRNRVKNYYKDIAKLNPDVAVFQNPPDEIQIHFNYNDGNFIYATFEEIFPWWL